MLEGPDASQESVMTALAFAALVVSGSLLLLTPMGGWHHTLGEAMIIGGVVGMLLTGIGVWRRRHDKS